MRGIESCPWPFLLDECGEVPASGMQGSGVSASPAEYERALDGRNEERGQFIGRVGRDSCSCQMSACGSNPGFEGALGCLAEWLVGAGDLASNGSNGAEIDEVSLFEGGRGAGEEVDERGPRTLGFGDDRLEQLAIHVAGGVDDGERKGLLAARKEVVDRADRGTRHVEIWLSDVPLYPWRRNSSFGRDHDPVASEGHPLQSRTIVLASVALSV